MTSGRENPEMTTRRYLLAAGAALAVLPLSAYAQRRLWRIGYLSASTAEANSAYLVAFRNGMAELGWSEAQQFVIDGRYSDGDRATFGRLVTEMVATQPDVILTVTDVPEFRLATRTIPLVFALAADPVATGYAHSLQRPGGNATGVTAFAPDLAAKRLQLLKEALPRTSHVLVLFQGDDHVAVSQAKEYQAAAKHINMRLSLRDVRQAADIDRVFTSPGGPAPDAYVIASGYAMNIHRKAIAEHLLRVRAPAVGSNAIYADAGLLMSYATSFPANFRRAAVYVDKILKGAKPGDLPIEQPIKLELVINARTAKAIGLGIPRSLLVQADRVIE